MLRCCRALELRFSAPERVPGLAAEEHEEELLSRAPAPHQLLEEGHLLGLLRVALKLVQAVLQFESQGVVVGPNHLQHLPGPQQRSSQVRPRRPQTTGWFQLPSVSLVRGSVRLTDMSKLWQVESHHKVTFVSPSRTS